MTSTIKVNKIEKESGSTLTIGGPGTAVTLACGATQTGFGRTGTVNWVTTKKTASFTAVSGEGYFCDTAAVGAFTLTLPASPSAGDIVGFKDYNGNFGTANLTIGRNSEPINGGSVEDVVISTDGASIFLVYVDGTQGWVATQDDESTFQGASFVTATGGDAVVTCGNFKTHIFTSSGNFVVSGVASSAPNNAADYVVVAGGGGAFRNTSAGGGAGGFRLSNALGIPAPTMSPLANGTGITLSAQTYPITVGAGGSPGPSGSAGGATNGSTSTFDSISSAGGGKGGSSGNGPGDVAGTAGGSGGGGDYNTGTTAGGAGNTPPVSPAQGNAGGTGSTGPSLYGPGGGGGAGAAGNSFPQSPGGTSSGGVGSFIADPFIGPTAPSYGTPGPVSSVRYFAGGGAGTLTPSNNSPLGGSGGGGKGTGGAGGAGTTNTGGGGGASQPNVGLGGAGGSGVVLIRYKFQ